MDERISEYKEVKEYKDERFEFLLYVNNNLICRRNFKINNFIENSMETLDFKNVVEDIVTMIDEDLKSKSRVYTWYYYDENNVDDEFKDPLIDPWECTLKFVVTDNKKEVISKIWDGYAYPKYIREKVDIANKTVKITKKDGRTYAYEKEAFFEANKERLSGEFYVIKAMMNDKPDLLSIITKKICETCSPREDGYYGLKDYSASETFGDGKEYFFAQNLINRKLIQEWDKATSEKSKQYFRNLY